MRPPNQQDVTLYLRLHALKDTPVQAEARAWFFQSFEAASYEELRERYSVWRGGVGERRLARQALRRMVEDEVAREAGSNPARPWA